MVASLFSKPGLWGTRASLVTACGLSSAWVYLLYSIWNLPEAGMGPVFPALAGGLFVLGEGSRATSFMAFVLFVANIYSKEDEFG